MSKQLCNKYIAKERLLSIKSQTLTVILYLVTMVQWSFCFPNVILYNVRAKAKCVDDNIPQRLRKKISLWFDKLNFLNPTK